MTSPHPWTDRLSRPAGSLPAGCRRRRNLWIPWTVLSFVALSAGLAAQESNPEDKKVLKLATDYYRSDRWDQAKAQAARISSHNTQEGIQAGSLLRIIETIETGRTRLAAARAANSKGDKQRACQLLAEVESSVQASPRFPSLPSVADRLPDLTKLRAQVGSCAGVLTLQQAEDFERAKQLAQTGKHEEARGILERLRREVRDNDEVAGLLEAVNRQIRISEGATREQQYERICDRAAAAFAQGNLVLARERAREALNLQPEGAKAKQLRQQIELADKNELAALGEGIDFFYAGAYDRARAKLQAFVTGKHSDARTALAYFYFGAAAASEYFLTGEKDAQKRKEASEQFVRARQAHQGPAPYRLEDVSPRIRSLYSDATRQPKP